MRCLRADELSVSIAGQRVAPTAINRLLINEKFPADIPLSPVSRERASVLTMSVPDMVSGLRPYLRVS